MGGQHKRKLEPGDAVRSLEDLIAALQRGQWIYLNHKAYDPGWIRSMHFWMIVRRVEARVLFYAVDVATGQPYVGTPYTEVTK